MQSRRFVVLTVALCVWTSLVALVRVNNLTHDLAPSSSCESTMHSNVPLLASNATSKLISTERTKWYSNKSRSPADQQATFEALPREPLPPVHINSTWIGNQWIPPPGYRLYSTREMQSYFQQQSILWVGDSTARRNYGTMFGILNATDNPNDVAIHDLDHESVLDMNKMSVDLKVPYPEPCNKSGYNLCRRIPTSSNDDSKLYDQMDAICIASLVNMTVNRQSQFWKGISNYSLVIFSIGPWELRDRCGPDEQKWQTRVDQFLHALHDRVDEDTSTANITFVWRTWGSIDYDIERKAKLSWKKAYMYNEYFKLKIDQHNERSQSKSLSAVSYIDWGQVMFPRSFPRSKRIRGDMQAHFGLEARLTFVQMLMNHLVERDRQKRWKG